MNKYDPKLAEALCALVLHHQKRLDQLELALLVACAAIAVLSVTLTLVIFKTTKRLAALETGGGCENFHEG